MKKLITVAGALALGMSLVACGKTPEPTPTPEPEVKTSDYIGLGYDAEFADGTATVTGAMVSFAKDGTIMGTRIDVVQVKIEAAPASETLTNEFIALKSNNTITPAGYVSTKLELGVNYNMKKYSSAIAEVDAQIEAYSKWTVGKTVEYVKTAMIAREGTEHEGAIYAKDADLWATTTISIDSFAAAIDSAWTNKVEAKVNATAKAGISLIGTISESSHGKGNDQVTVDMGGVFVEDGKVVAAQIDAVTFSFAAGAVENRTTKYYDASGKSLSKKVLHDDYHMVPVSANEWYVHAAAIETYAVGKTAEQIAATEATGAIEGATITYTAYTLALSNAAKYAVMEHIGPQA